MKQCMNFVHGALASTKKKLMGGASADKESDCSDLNDVSELNRVAVQLSTKVTSAQFYFRNIAHDVVHVCLLRTANPG